MYSKKLIDHYENPRNIGSLDKNDAKTGTGLVGAPACFAGETLISTADGRKAVTIEKLYKENILVPVWSFNLLENKYEIKFAKVIYSGKKLVNKVTLSDKGYILVTPEHKFLLKNGKYRENNKITNESIRMFKRKISERGYWKILTNCPKIWDEEYKFIYKFNTNDYDLEGYNIHHIDHNKNNDNINNLKKLSIAEHARQHKGSNKDFTYLLAKNKITVKKALQDSYDRAEAANILNITTEELYFLLGYYGISTKRRKLKEEIQKEISERQKGLNNSFYKFSRETQERFKAMASKPGSKNGRWINITNEELIKLGNSLFLKYNKLTVSLWTDFSKKEGLPQNPFRGGARFSSFNEFKELCINYNHTIISQEEFGIVDTYTLQVEENNNYVVLSKMSKNIQEGIVVKNCGDVMKLQIKVENDVISDAKFKTFGCGSAIASSSLLTEWVKGKKLEEAGNIKNTEIAKELALPPVKIHCSVLAEDAIKAAIKDYKDKNKGD